MPVATKAHLAVAGAKSAQVRTTRRRQRLALREAPPATLVGTLIDPPSELATYRLGLLFACGENGARGVIPGFGASRLRVALAKLSREGHWWAHTETRLNSLTTEQRRALLAAVLEVAPPAWRRRTK